MEFDSHFAIIQGVLKSQEKIHGKLQIINSGNESKVDTIKKKLSEAIDQASMNDDNLRRVYLLLFLNTDNECFDCLYDNPNYGHVIGIIPKLSKYLFIEIITFLKFDNFLYESILFLPPVLSIEVIEMYVILLKTKDPFQLFKYVDFILRAIFIKLILLHINNESNFNIKLKYFEFFQSIIGHFNSSKIDDYKSWEQNKLYYFSACIMKSITSVVKTCCKFYIEPVFIDDANIKIYNIEINKEFQKEVKIRIDENIDILKNSMQLILSKFLTTAQSITVLTWISWIELDEYTKENLQVIIGNEIYCCLQFINQEKIKSCINSHLYSELTAVLSNLSIKPIDETDEIKSADIETILNNIKNPNKNQTQWLSALIKNENFVPDVASLDIIQEKVHLISQEDNEILLNKYMKFIEQNDNLDSNLIILFKNIILSALKNIHVDNQVVLLQSFFKMYGTTDSLKLPDFDSKLIEVFNKFVDKDDQTMDFYIDLISLTFQSPETVVNKAVKEALSNVHHGRLMVDVLKVLKFVCSFEVKESNNSLLFNIIDNVMLDLDELSDNEKDNFAVLVTRLIKKNLIDGNKFLTSCLMIKLYDNIKLQKWSDVVVMLDVLKSSIDDSINKEDNELNLPVHIIFLCQLLDITRCSLPNYNSQLNIVYDKALEVLTTTIESFSVEEEKIAAVNWMKQELQKLNVISQMHVLSYIPSISDIISKTSIELYWLKVILCGEGANIDVSFLSDMRKDIFLRTLLKVLPCFTIREWKIMFNNIVPKEEGHHLHELFITVADAVLLLEASIVPHISDLNSNDDITNISDDDKISGATTVSANACLSFIIKNLITVVQDIIFPHVKEMSKENLAEVFIKICKILHDFPHATQNYSSWALLKVLQDLIIYAELPKIDNEKPNVLEISKFCAGIGLIPHVELRMNLSKALLSSIKTKETCV